MAHQTEFQYPNGIAVVDKVTGFKGVITAQVERINGCLQYSVQPRIAKEDSNYVPDGMSIDEVSLIPDHNVEQVVALPPHTVTFKYNTGDNLRHRINGFCGGVVYMRHDLNGCVSVMVEGKFNEKEGKQVRVIAFEQEWEFVDAGLNAAEEKPVERKRTGCQPEKLISPYC